MKIVSWNANGGFRNKYKELLALDADIYVVQECEDPATCKDEAYKQMFSHAHWIGKQGYKGIMVFTARPWVKLELQDWQDGGKRFFIPVRVNDNFTLVASWACDPYCEELYDWLEVVEDRIDPKTIIIGDLNSNAVFDPKHFARSGKSFGMVLEKLVKYGIVGIYHHYTKQEHGEEVTPTFFLYRHLDKPFHLDHCLANPNHVKSIKVHCRANWLMLSDHVPIEVEV